MSGWRDRAARLRHGALLTVAALSVVFGLTGCGPTICGANPVLDALFCRDDSGTPPPANLPPPPAVPKQAPYASIELSEYVVSAGERVTLDGSWNDSDGQVTKFEWDLDGDGQYEIEGVPAPSNQDRRTVSFQDFGDHTVALRVTDSDGLTAVETDDITVARRHPVAVLTITPAHPNVGQQVTFDASASHAPDSTVVRYRWDIDGNTSNGYELATTEPVVTRTYTRAQTITVGVRAFDDQGDRGEVRRQLTIGTTSAPTAPGRVRAVLVLRPNPALFEEEVTLDGTRSTGPIVSYEWDLDGNGTFELNTGSVATAFQSYFRYGTITLALRVRDITGRSDVARADLHIVRSRLLAALSRPAATARAFSARLDARPVRGRPGRVERRGAVQTVKGALVSGSFNGRVARTRRASSAEKLLGKLLRSRYRAGVDASVDAQKRTGTTTMLVLATFPRTSPKAPAARACVRITIVKRPGWKPVGTFRVLGGTREASRLDAQGTFTFTPGRKTTSKLIGRLTARLVGARALPRACAALASP